VNDIIGGLSVWISKQSINYWSDILHSFRFCRKNGSKWDSIAAKWDFDCHSGEYEADCLLGYVM
jgi:hypothetical protein